MTKVDADKEEFPKRSTGDKYKNRLDAADSLLPTVHLNVLLHSSEMLSLPLSLNSQDFLFACVDVHVQCLIL